MVTVAAVMRERQSWSSGEYEGVGPTEMYWGGPAARYLVIEEQVLLVPKVAQRSWKVFRGVSW